MSDVHPPAGRHRRAAAALSLLALGVIGFALMQHVSSVLGRHDAAVRALEGQGQVLARVIAQGAVATAPSGPSGRGLFDLAEPTMAAARLQGQITQIVEQQGAAPTSSQALPIVVEDGLGRLPVRIMFEATIEQLTMVLKAIEEGPSLMVVGRIVIADADGGLQRGGIATEPNALRVDMTVDVYGRAP